jgi:hypothetical protein
VNTISRQVSYTWQNLTTLFCLQWFPTSGFQYVNKASFYKNAYEGVCLCTYLHCPHHSKVVSAALKYSSALCVLYHLQVSSNASWEHLPSNFLCMSSLLFAQCVCSLIAKHSGFLLKFLWCIHFTNHSLISCSLPTHPMSEIVTFQHAMQRTLLPTENKWNVASPCLRISEHFPCKTVIWSGYCINMKSHIISIWHKNLI